MNKKKLELEIWADSFHEGFWACENLIKVHKEYKRNFKLSYKNGFIPVFTYFFNKLDIQITVYGSYLSWDPVPKPILDLISWGKPDFLLYNPHSKEIYFAIEETAAVPTGNQALQRCERLYGASRFKIPFWYLLPEYGIHKDEGTRRDSIWPTIMAIKLTIKNLVPSTVLHYSDFDNPEVYDFGAGLEHLFSSLYKILENICDEKKVLSGMDALFEDQILNMLNFIKSQYKNIVDYLPGDENLENPEILNILKRVYSGEKEAVTNLEKKFSKFLNWPKLTEIEKPIKQSSSKLIKHDNFSFELEKSIDDKSCYTLSSNAGSRPQNINDVKGWLEKQKNSFENLKNKLKIKNDFNLKINDFPKSKNGNLHLTTAKNILYLFDNFQSIKKKIYKVFPNNQKKLEYFDNHLESLVYISNSIRPGRIFGDPFTGQISAYSSIFGYNNQKKRLIISYFPHQSFSQFLDTNNKNINNKGFTIMRELVDLIILAGGVMLRFNKNGRAEII